VTDERGTLVDSNVLLDVLTEDPTWMAWSADRLAEAVDRGPVLINQVVYAEVSLRFSTVEALDETLSPDRFVRGNIPWPAAFLAARCYRQYRARGGRKSTLPDFFIGAHAAVLKLPLLTRDTRRYRTYFPTVELIAPS
jgi:predicted nucleic acid-binding protein